tara:strand:+ start:11451 stop:12881 length:1431 start_codon:yes stop_codon:yes gene_type:complete
MFSRDTYKGQGIQMPTGRSRAPEILAKGFSDLGAGIGKGIQGWKQNKAETKTTRAMLNSAADMEYAGAQDSKGFDSEAGAAAYETRKANIEGMSLSEMKGELDAQAMNRTIQAIKNQTEEAKAKTDYTNTQNKMLIAKNAREQDEHDTATATDRALGQVYNQQSGNYEGPVPSIDQSVGSAMGANPGASSGVLREKVQDAFGTKPLTPSEQTAQDSFELRKQQEARSVAKSLREREIPGEGIARSVDIRKELTKSMMDHAQAVPLIDDLLGVANESFFKRYLSRHTAGKVQAGLTQLKGLIRTTLVGPGAVSESEWEMINNVIANPSEWGTSKKKVKAALNSIRTALEFNLEYSKELGLMDYKSESNKLLMDEFNASEWNRYTGAGEAANQTSGGVGYEVNRFTSKGAPQTPLPSEPEQQSGGGLWGQGNPSEGGRGLWMGGNPTPDPVDPQGTPPLDRLAPMAPTYKPAPSFKPF